ncbi:hypothetical protein QG37_08022 [Candidozyma auris]|uniref:Uncharacterized protein n=1 Tax=Candidozyma auris TaxID=498019 RepID=A0A0L0NNH1_CANAR|nr:hypothetical protein QG37_08022 [[Candida] auris]
MAIRKSPKLLFFLDVVQLNMDVHHRNSSTPVAVAVAEKNIHQVDILKEFPEESWANSSKQKCEQEK